MAKQNQKQQQHYFHKHHQQQQQRQHQQNHVSTYSSSLLLCGTTILLLCGVASGNGNMNAAGNHNYTSYAFPAETQSARDISTIETEVPQSPLISNTNDDTKTIIDDKKLQAPQSNNLEGSIDNPFKELNIVKRAPNGFVGMRGKKEFQYADADNNMDEEFYGNPNQISDWNLDPLYRVLGGNEADYDDSAYYEGHRFKKAPTAFYGVRGKKLPGHNGNGYTHLNEMLERLEEDHVRERMLQDFIGRLAAATAAQNEINKRAPTGFTGLRGKRPEHDWNIRDDVADDGNGDGNGNSLEYYEKRAPVNAFVGVRGKKDIDSEQEVHQNVFKRSPSESFGSGKRRLADFNNKFVAVRGKKDVMPDSEDERRPMAAQYGNRQQLRYFMNVLPSLVYGNVNLKRAPSGFVGMRGKRAAVNAA